ncbi:MAG: hypothetical protein U9Q68_03835 [Euryarchaeota archaeon]|nr:hypothetical protein [Euryarchaeota archaeon]
MTKQITVGNYGDYQDHIQDRFREFAQRTSNFQIEKFVACSDSQIPSHQYRHVLVQMRVALTELRRRLTERERAERKQARAIEHKPIDYDLDVAEAITEIEHLGYGIDAKLIEINKYAEIMTQLEKEHGKPFTNEEYQADEPEYWRRRLAQQLHDAVVDRQTGCGTSNLVAMREACCESPLPGSKNRIDVLPIELNELNQISEGRKMNHLIDEGDRS